MLFFTKHVFHAVLILISTLGLAVKESSNFAQKFEAQATNMAAKFEAPTIGIADLKNMPPGKVILLDARELEEFQTSHLPNAKHIGYKNFNLEKTLKTLPLEQKVIVYCSMGYRSGDIASRLRKKGIDAYNLKGGIFAWHNAGFKVVNSQKKQTNDVHPYNKTWGKWLLKKQ